MREKEHGMCCQDTPPLPSWHMYKIHHLFCQWNTPFSAANTLHRTEGLPKAAPLGLDPPLGNKLCFAGPQNQHCGGHNHNYNQQHTQDPYTQLPLCHDKILNKQLIENNKNTYLQLLPNLVEGWVGAVWQSHTWPAVPGSWAGRLQPEGHTLFPPHSPRPPYSTLEQHYLQTHTSLFLKTHGQIWEREMRGLRGYDHKMGFQIMNTWGSTCNINCTLPCGVEVCLLH